MERLRAGRTAKWSLAPDKLGASVAETDFGTAPAVVEAVVVAMQAGRHGYPPQWLFEAASKAAADWYHDWYGWEVDPAMIQQVADVLSVLEYMIRSWTLPGGKVIVPTPAYMPFLTIPETLGRRVVEVPMRFTAEGWMLDLEALDMELRAPQSLLVLCNPHNPIGRSYTREELLSLSRVVERHGARVFCDEIHAPLTYQRHSHIPYAGVNEQAASHTVTATSASKAWNIPGLKCAQVIFSHEPDRERWLLNAGQVAHGASILGLEAASAAYEHGREWLVEVLKYLRGNRDFLCAELADRLPATLFLPPEATYLAWLDFSAYHLTHPPAAIIEEAGAVVVDGARCGRVGDGCVRVNFGTPRPILGEIIDRIVDGVVEVASDQHHGQ